MKGLKFIFFEEIALILIQRLSFTHVLYEFEWTILRRALTNLNLKSKMDKSGRIAKSLKSHKIETQSLNEKSSTLYNYIMFVFVKTLQ